MATTRKKCPKGTRKNKQGVCVAFVKATKKTKLTISKTEVNKFKKVDERRKALKNKLDKYHKDIGDLQSNFLRPFSNKKTLKKKLKQKKTLFKKAIVRYENFIKNNIDNEDFKNELLSPIEELKKLY